jgi:predicted nucleic acid-binding protein
MRFWDSSALVALFLRDPRRKQMRSYYEQDPLIVVWWATPVEITSALTRQERNGDLNSGDAAAVLQRLEKVSPEWQEIQPTPMLRNTALRLLRVHSLRAADALQLAAALTAAHTDLSSLEVVCLDQRLSEAARREGLRVLE